uniref:Putative mucin-like protein 1 ctenocephalides felis n=1 Tax=Xenopsylla cheopis TaxID=163159 RepID=A0A6M2DYK2_XENCH
MEKFFIFVLLWADIVVSISEQGDNISQLAEISNGMLRPKLNMVAIERQYKEQYHIPKIVTTSNTAMKSDSPSTTTTDAPSTTTTDAPSTTTTDAPSTTTTDAPSTTTTDTPSTTTTDAPSTTTTDAPSTTTTDTPSTTTTPPQNQVCKTVGLIYPDQEDCHAYFSCLTVGELPKHFVCNKGTYFDRIKKRCVRGECENSTELPPTLDICYEIGTIVPDPRDCHAYFACVKIGSLPQHFVCVKGTYFNEYKKRCVRGECGISSSTTTISTLPTLRPPWQEPCVKVGEIIKDPTDCHAYFACLKIGSLPQHFICNKGTYFDVNKKRCVRGECNTTSTTTLSTLSTTISTLTTIRPPWEQICAQVGEIMKDPKDCHSYFSCLKIDALPRHFTCNKGTYFDYNKKRCIRGEC